MSRPSIVAMTRQATLLEVTDQWKHFCSTKSHRDALFAIGQWLLAQIRNYNEPARDLEGKA